MPVKTVAPHSAGPFENMVRPYATVVAFVDGKGNVTAASIGVASGNNTYDKAAVQAMKSWTFMPAAAGCQSLPGEIELAVGGNDTSFADPCNHDASATRSATPDLPDIAQQSGVPVHASTNVDVDQFGEVTKVSVHQSSGMLAFDRALIKAAMQSNYFPAIKNCMPIAMTYVFNIDFAGRP